MSYRLSTASSWTAGNQRGLLTAQALINKLIWAIATEYDCLVRKRRRGFNPYSGKEYKGFHVVSRKNLKGLLKRSQEGTLDWQLPIKGFIEYCKRWWQGASEEKKTFRNIRNQLDYLFGVCEIDRSNQEWQTGKDGNPYTRDIPILKGVNFEKLLLLYECIEIALRYKCGIVKEEFFDMMPDHRGYCAVMIFEKVFPDRMFHRSPDGMPGTKETSSGEDEDEEEEVPVPPLEAVNSTLEIEKCDPELRAIKLGDGTFWSQCVLAKLAKKGQQFVQQLRLEL